MTPHHRKDTTMQTTPRHPWARNERGESVVAVMIGALIGSIVIGGFFTFWLRTNDSGTQVADHAAQQSAGVESLNRISRDVRAAHVVLNAGRGELVLQKKNADQTLTRTYYRVAGEGNDGTLESLTLNNLPSSTGFDADAAWESDKVIARKVNTDNTRFGYKDKDGATLDPDDDIESDVKLVTTDFDAHAGTTGRVALRSAAALDAAEGDTVNPGDRSDPAAHDDAVQVRKGGSTVTVNVISNDECPAGSGAGTCNPGQVTVAQTATALPTGLTVTPNGVGGFTVSVTSSYAGADASSATETFGYILADAEGDTDSATVTVTINPPPRAPDATDNSLAQRVGSTETTNVLGNDQCDNGSGVLVLGCPSPADPIVSIVRVVAKGPDNTWGTADDINNPTGLTVTVNGSDAVVTTLDESYGGTGVKTVGADDVRIFYRLVDGHNPTLDGNDSNTTAGDDAVFTVYPGPAARDDIATVQADVGGVASILANDRMNTGTTLTWVTALPSWVTADASGNVTLDPDDGQVGTHTFTYRVTDPRGGWANQTDTATFTVTVTAGPPVVTVTAGAYNYRSNRVSISGGNGAYKLYRATGVNASGQPTGTVVKVCDSTDSDPGNDCANPFNDTTVGLGSTWVYAAYDSRTPNPEAAAPSKARRYATGTVLQFPDDPTMYGIGSDTDENTTVDQWGVASLRWTLPTGATRLGLKTYLSFDFFGPFLRAPQDVGVWSMSPSSGANPCPSGWSDCLRLGGYQAGTEQIFQPYSLNECTLVPGSPVAVKVSGGVSYCPSPALTATIPAYSNTTAGKANHTDGDSSATGAEAVRTYQAPAAPATFTVGNGTADACRDVADSDTNGVYNCDNNSATARLLVDGDVVGSNGDGERSCSWATYNTCYGQVLRNGSVLQNGLQNTASGWSIVPSASTVFAGAYGATETLVGRSCNPGGCGAGVTHTVNSYPKRVSISVTQDNGNQYRSWWSQEARPNQNAALGHACWDTNSSDCFTDEAATATFTWTASEGHNHYSLGGYQHLANSWGYDQGGGACYNFGLRSKWRNDDAAAVGSPDVHTDGDVYVNWHANGTDGSGNVTGYKQCQWTLGGPAGVPANYSQWTVPVPATAAFELAADPVGNNWLRQRSSVTLWTAPPPVSYLSDAPFCNPGVDGWRLGGQWRATNGYKDSTGTNQTEYASAYQFYYWYGATATAENEDGVPFFAGLAQAGTNYVPNPAGATWGEPNGYRFNTTYSVGNDGNPGTPDIGWDLQEFMIGNGDPYYTVPAKRTMTGIFAVRSFQGPGFIASLEAGTGWENPGNARSWNRTGFRWPVDGALSCTRATYDWNVFATGSESWRSPDGGVYVSRRGGPGEPWRNATPKLFPSHVPSYMSWNGVY